jgi:hypothetical protein
VQVYLLVRQPDVVHQSDVEPLQLLELAGAVL